MSVHYNKTRKQFYICYKLKIDDNKYKTITITNAEWTKSKGKKYVLFIEEDIIKKDKEERLKELKKTNNKKLNKNDNSVKSVLKKYFNEIYKVNKWETAYGKQHKITKYFCSFFDKELDKPIINVLTIKSLDDFRTYILDSVLDVSDLTKNKLFSMIREFIDFTADRDYIDYELAMKLKRLLKPLSVTNVPNDKIDYWTNEEWKQFYSSFKNDDPWRILFLTAYVCGLRIGELLALKWNCFNSENGTLTINYSINNHGTLTTPKNSSSIDNVQCSKSLIAELLNLKKYYNANDEDFIFFSDKRTSKTTIRRIMFIHEKMAKVHHLKFHGLRHSCASRMINAGCSPLMVSKHLRHSSTKETLDTYSHLFPSETIGIIDKLFD